MSTKPCSEPECSATYQNHRWGRQRAANDGWFFQLNGDNWCPNHHPAWLGDWKKKKGG